MPKIHFPQSNLSVYRYPEFSANGVIPRHIDVWVPPGYEETDVRSPVLYMHDGQNLFDPETSTWNVTWGVAEAVSRLANENKIRAPIIVGIWNSNNRGGDYMPEKPFNLPGGKKALQYFLREYAGCEPVSDNYLRFIVESLKPLIDSEFRTLPERGDTYVMGASMGGLISLYALCEYPGVFTAAGCLSTHWVAGEGIVIDYLIDALPAPGAHNIYFDYGTKGLDARYEPYQVRADAIMSDAGYLRNENWMTEKFEGADHNERAWQDRIHIPLRFLLGI